MLIIVMATVTTEEITQLKNSVTKSETNVTMATIDIVNIL
jgi:hypothetical protein